jgi:fructose-1,6-bisphosphatase/inositol monophosphatase family enzyme
MLYEDLAKARPGYGFIGEEGGTRQGADQSHTWIVDPLDGTTNFLHGIPQFAISIALQREGTVIAGVIYNPANDELYTAERGKGAFLNDSRLRVAGRRKLGCRISGAAITNCLASKWPSYRTGSLACGASAQPASTWPSSPPAALTAIGSATFNPGTWPQARSSCARLAVSCPPFREMTTR